MLQPTVVSTVQCGEQPALPQENYDYSLERDCSRKLELQYGSRGNENVADGDSTRPRSRGLRSRRALRLDVVGRYCNTTPLHRNRRKRYTKWRRTAPWP